MKKDFPKCASQNPHFDNLFLYCAVYFYLLRRWVTLLYTVGKSFQKLKITRHTNKRKEAKERKMLYYDQGRCKGVTGVAVCPGCQAWGVCNKIPRGGSAWHPQWADFHDWRGCRSENMPADCANTPGDQPDTPRRVALASPEGSFMRSGGRFSRQ